MKHLPPQARQVLRHPGAFIWQTLKAFRANQGLLLAGAVAYYTLLSIVPLLILMVIALSHVVDQAELLTTLRRALEHVVPGQGKAVVVELAAFLEHREVIGWVLLVTMIFFSSLAFKVLENAISVIFLNRVVPRQRHILVSVLLPFGYIVFIGALLFVGTYVLGDLVAFGKASIVIVGESWSFQGVSRVVTYLVGMAVEILLISSIYYFMPVGRLTATHALIGGATAGVLWEIIRHGLVWYFGTLSQVNVLYGSLTTAIIVLLGLEVIASLLLFGAQVIAEYERFGVADPEKPPAPLKIGAEVATATKQEPLPVP